MSGDLKAQLDFVADTTGAEAGVSRMKRSMSELGPAAAKAGQQAADGLAGAGAGGGRAAKDVDAATRSIIGSIQRTSAVLEAGSRTNSKYFEVLATQRGANLAALKPYLDQLDAISAKTKAATSATLDFTSLTSSLGATSFKSPRDLTTSLGATAFGSIGEEANKASAVASAALGNVGLSAKQTAAALRGVPAQFTDIVTSIQGGQQPLTVLLQQGGQLKDMFGGAGPAARALGGYILGLINPFTLLAAAVGVTALAYHQGSKEAEAYGKALILTGNYAGTTKDQLADMARELAEGNRSQGKSAEVLAAIAASGAVAGDQLKRFSAAAIDFEKASGQAIKKTVDVFKELEAAPLDASVKLNAEIHYLTLSTYEHIKALDDQGKHVEAARAAQEAYADSLASRTAQLLQNQGLIERGWQGITGAAKGAWDAMLGVGRQETAAQQLAGIEARLSQIQAERARRGFATSGGGAAFGGGNAGFNVDAKRDAEESALKARAAALRAVTTAAGESAKAEAERARQVQAAASFDKEKEKFESNKQKRDREVTNATNLFKASGRDNPAELNTLIKNIEEKYKDKTTKAFSDDAGTKMLLQLREQEASLKAQLVTDDKRTAALQEQAKFEQLIADIKEKKQLTADQKSLLGAADKIRAQLALNVGVEHEIELKKAATKEEERRKKALEETAAKADGIRRTIADEQRTRNEQNAERLGVMGLGNEAAEQLRSRFQIENQYARLQRQLTEEAAKNKNLESEAYKQGTEDIKAALRDSLAANDAYYKAVKDKQQDWQLGATQALRNYADESANIFKQVESAVSGAFRGMEDALVTFVTTGKLDFKSLVDSIIADLVRIQIRKNITGPLAGVLDQVLKGGGGGGASTGDSQTDVLAGLGGGSGGGLGSLFTSAFQTIFGGGRYNGGSVSKGKLYEVGEGNRSELLNVAGKQYLIPGNNGSVQPGQGDGGGGGGGNVFNFYGQTNRNELVGAAVQISRRAAAIDRRQELRRRTA